jgi:hypothetical protein
MDCGAIPPSRVNRLPAIGRPLLLQQPARSVSGGCGYAHAGLRGAQVVDAEAGALAVRLTSLHLARVGVAGEVRGAVPVGGARSGDAMARRACLAQPAASGTPWEADAGEWRADAGIVDAHHVQRGVSSAVRVRGAPAGESGAAASGKPAAPDAEILRWHRGGARTLTRRRARCPVRRPSSVRIAGAT